MVKKAVDIIAEAKTKVNGKVTQTFKEDLFNTADTPSRGTKIRAVSFEIKAKDHKAAITASILMHNVSKVFLDFSLIANSGKPSDSKLTSIFLCRYWSVNLIGYIDIDCTSSTKVNHLAFFLLYRKNLSLS